MIGMLYTKVITQDNLPFHFNMKFWHEDLLTLIKAKH